MNVNVHEEILRDLCRVAYAAERFEVLRCYPCLSEAACERTARNAPLNPLCF